MKSTTKGKEVARTMTTRSMAKMTSAIEAKKTAKEVADSKVVNNQKQSGNKNENKENRDSDKFYSENSDDDDTWFTTSTKWVPIYTSNNSEKIVDMVEVHQRNILPFNEFSDRFGPGMF